MLRKKLFFFIGLAFLCTSCADTWNSVKQGVTGAKQKSSDEFLVKKKDPLILPPDFESLPTPDEQSQEEEVTSFEKTLTSGSSSDTDSSSESNAEISILEQIRRK
tara:strand:+ start:267 stop:581 length:315 start_codon:yes stop_codon:yes gene_type:complete